MAPNRLNARWLQTGFAAVALCALAILGGCGGGNGGAPNNPFAPKPVAPGPILILPTTLSVYSGRPASLAVTGGVPAYFVTSSNPTVLPLGSSKSTGTIVLLPANVVAALAVTITVTDSVGSQATATVTVNPAPIFNTLTVTPASSTCGTNAICSGQTATASVTVMGPDGAPIQGRQVRYDVVTGAFAIQSSDPATPLVSTFTVTSDVFGHAHAIIQATAGAATQPAQLRATDITSGDQQTAQFTIVQTTNGTAVLSVVPMTATIMGPDTATCSSGFVTDYYIYGGTPPYNVASTFPNAIGISGVPVPASGDAFRTVTNGTCVNPLTFTISDATGVQTTATLINQVGTMAPVKPPTPTALSLTPGSYAPAACTSSTPFTFIVAGGTPAYNISSTQGTATPSIVNASGGSTTVNFAGTVHGPVAVVAVDSGLPQLMATSTISCP